MEITGKVFKVMPVQTGTSKTGNTWSKVDFVIETDARYDNKICFTAWSDKVRDVENLQLGQTVKVSFDLSSREYNDKWFTDIKAWRIDVNPSTTGSGGSSSSQNYEQAPMASAPSASNNSLSEEGGASDDLPF